MLESELPHSPRINILLKEAEEKIKHRIKEVKRWENESDKLTESMKGLYVT